MENQVMEHIARAQRNVLAAGAIVSCFETGRPSGKADAVAVLPDGAGISYGMHQATDSSDSLDEIVKLYVARGGVLAEKLSPYVGELAKNTKSSIWHLSRDENLKKLLRDAGKEPLMAEVQNEVFAKRYMGPAIQECANRKFQEPLSLAVIYDSKIHGAFDLIAKRVPHTESEYEWIPMYLAHRRHWLANHSKQILRNTVYRQDTFFRLLFGEDQRQENIMEFCKAIVNRRVANSTISAMAANGNWKLTTPFSVFIGKSANKLVINETDIK